MKITFSNEVSDIPLKDIRVSESNVRLTDREVEIEDLAKSIEQHGLLQPVDLRGKFGEPPYELIVGQRRFLAHQLLKKQGKLPKGTIRAVFLDRDVSNIAATILSLAENMHRVELNHADKAKAITDLYKHYSKDDRRVARELGLPLRRVRDYIAIEEQATPKAKDLLREGKVSKADVKRVIDAAQGDTKKADKLIEKIPALSKYEKIRAVSFGMTNPKASVEEIVKESQKQKILYTVFLSLPKELGSALNQAAEKLSMDRESIAVKALSEWLKNNGYLASEG